MQKINSFRGNYFFLSNFYESPVEYNGLTYKNVESAFQAQKTLSEAERIPFTNMSGTEAKRAGRRVTLRKDWESVKVSIMKDIVTAKFTQNLSLKNALLQTAGFYLEEGNAWRDYFWGTVNGVGQNHLGKILMEVRDELS